MKKSVFILLFACFGASLTAAAADIPADVIPVRAVLPSDNPQWLLDRIANLADSVQKASDSKDIRRLKELRASVIETIGDIEQRISRIEEAAKESKEKERGLFGSIGAALSNSFRERKLTWLRDMRGFLLDERDQIDAVISGVVKANAFTASRAESLKVKMASKLKGLF